MGMLKYLGDKIQAHWDGENAENQVIDNTNVNRALHAQNVLIARQTQLIDRLQERMEQSQQQIEAQNQQIWRSQQQVEAQTQQIKRLADCFAQASHGTVHTAVHTAALNIEPCITTPAANPPYQQFPLRHLRLLLPQHHHP